MSGYKTDQRRVLYHGHEFHFVSYEGVAANPRRGQEAAPPTWFLMRAGKRWFVMPQIVDQNSDDLDRQLHEWLDLHVGLPPAGGSPAPLAVGRRGEPGSARALVSLAERRARRGRASGSGR